MCDTWDTLLPPPPPSHYTHTPHHTPPRHSAFWKLRSIVCGVDVTCGGAAHIAKHADPPITALELEGPGFALDMPDAAMYVHALQDLAFDLSLRVSVCRYVHASTTTPLT